MISAIVLAAGQSLRMGSPKMILPWGKTTVIGQVVSTLSRSGVEEIIVITGGARQAVEKAIHGLPARTIFNPVYAQGEMLSTCQAGLAALGDDCEAALIVLGDQPKIEARVVKSILAVYHDTHALLVVPSFQMRRGHPWLLDRALWPSVLALTSPATLRDFLNDHASQIHYLPVENDSVLMDLDTHEEYQRHRPQEEVK